MARVEASSRLLGMSEEKLDLLGLREAGICLRNNHTPNSCNKLELIKTYFRAQYGHLCQLWVQNMVMARIHEIMHFWFLFSSGWAGVVITSRGGHGAGPGVKSHFGSP